MFRHKECKGTCGSKSCSEWMLGRLATVVKDVEILQADEGLDVATIVELTGLEKDFVGPTIAYRGGYPFSV